MPPARLEVLTSRADHRHSSRNLIAKENGCDPSWTSGAPSSNQDEAVEPEELDPDLHLLMVEVAEPAGPEAQVAMTTAKGSSIRHLVRSRQGFH